MSTTDERKFRKFTFLGSKDPDSNIKAESQQQLATQYNVSYGCVAGINQRKNWKHI